MIDIPLSDVKKFLRVPSAVTVHDDVIERCYDAAVEEAGRELGWDKEEPAPADVEMFVLKRTYRHFEHRVDGVTSETVAGVGSVNLSEDSKMKRGRVKYV